jgi:hypothetical protein
MRRAKKEGSEKKDGWGDDQSIYAPFWDGGGQESPSSFLKKEKQQ